MTSQQIPLVVADEPCTCGYIKAKFPRNDDRPVGEQPWQWASREFKSVHLTDNFCYVNVGHTELPSNDLARALITAIETYGGKITRLDFTIDVVREFDYVKWYDSLRNAYEALPSKVGTPKPSLWTSVDGHTVYVGKRSSARMLRVYDKAAEIKAKDSIDIEMPLMRIEIEIKRDYVKTYKALFMAKDTKAIVQDVAARYDLLWLCQEPRKVKPYPITRATEGPLSFVRRYHRVLKEAWQEDKEEFLDLIGANIYGNNKAIE